jgi:hypothetical protein
MLTAVRFRAGGIVMRLSRLLPALAIALLAAMPAARAEVLIAIDKFKQQMTVTVDGVERHVWPVSTGRARYDTPAGDFQPFRMERHHYSREWDDAPMPHSIFFTKAGHAIHGSYERRRLGRPASHGCVRLAPENAATLFALVKEQGVKNARVTLTGDLPSATALAARFGDNSAEASAPRPRKPRTRDYDVDSRSDYYRDSPYYARRNYGFPFLFGW